MKAGFYGIMGLSALMAFCYSFHLGNSLSATPLTASMSSFHMKLLLKNYIAGLVHCELVYLNIEIWASGLKKIWQRLLFHLSILKTIVDDPWMQFSLIYMY